MRINNFKALLKTALRVVCILPLAAVVAFGQQVVNLTAGPTSVTLPDGSTVPMWGYSCGLPVTTNAAPTATCAALNPHAPAATATTPAGWSPVVITVPTGQALTINLTNNLTFQPPTPTGGTAPLANTVPTSLMIVGQLGGGLGGAPTTTTSPTHPSQVVTWSTVGSAPAFTPPPQGARVQSFGTEVAAAGSTLGTGQVASGSALTWTAPRPGTYLLESGTHPSIQGPMGLIGMLVVTTAPAGTTAGTAYPGSATGVTPVVPAVTYNADIDLLLSEIDPVQNRAVNAAVNTAGFAETNVWSGQPGQCGNPGSPVGVVNTCYPPAVNYTPLYYLFNGVAFSKTNAPASLFPTSLGTAAAPVTGTVLVRLVNAGLRMHVPSIIGSQTGTAVSPATPPSGFSIIAEDGNLLPGIPRVQSEVFMPAGKTNDVMINVPAAGGTALPVFDRELSLSGNAIGRDTGMLAYIGANGAGLPAAVAIGGAVARNDPYPSLVAGQTFTVSDPSKGVIANDTNVYGVQLLAAPTNGTVTLNANGTFTYVPTGTATSDSFTYCANGSVTGTACSSGVFATVNLTAAAIGTAPSAGNTTYNANVAGYLAIKTPGVLSFDSDPSGYPLQIAVSTVAPASGLSVNMSPDGAFTATLATPNTVATTATFTYQAQNSQGTFSNTATVTINFPVPSNLQVTVVDGVTKIPLPQVAGANGVLTQDFRWIIEEDRSYYVDPNNTTNTTTGTTGPTAAPTFGVNFHTSTMPYVAQGCTGPNSCESGQTMIDTGTPCTTPGVPANCSATAGQHVPAVCDVGDGSCRIAAAGSAKTAVLPSQVSLDPSKRYYISVLPGDAADPFYAAGPVGHGMGGAPIPFACTLVPPATTCTGTFADVTVYSEPSPYPPGKLAVFVFQDDFPLNGEHDGGGGGVGGIDTTIASNEQGLGQFQIHLWDAFGGSGDFTGQMSYDMFNQPLSNSLAGTIDPATGFDACPISTNPRNAADATSTGITGMIVTCPTFESDKKTFSPLAGQAVIANLMPGRWGVIASPGADRIARGEEWLQTNTLDGQKAHDVFTRISEPNFFQEYGPSGFHVSIGFANPKIINSRLKGICAGTDPNLPGVGGTGHCNNTIKGTITGERLSRPPDERIYGSTSHDAFAWTQSFVSVGDPDGEDFAFTKCAADGTFTLTGIPDGDWRITTFDQWNDQLVDGLSTPVRVGNTTGPFCPGPNSSANVCNMGDIAATQWQTNVNIRTFMDENKDGIANKNAAGNYTEGGIPLLNVAVRLRDGSLANLLATDFDGTTNFNETFPLFSWYTVETDVTRYKNTGTHVVYDAGGPADGTLTTCGGTLNGTGYPPCGTSTIGKTLANTVEQVSLPTNLRVPGSVYCANADCTGKSIQTPASDPPSVCTTSTTGVVTCSTKLSTGRIDPPWVGVEGWQGFPGQNSFIEFGKEPYAAGENGGIKGHVVYASTRPFDDPYMLVQTQWTPLVPNVTINLYQEGVAADKITPTLTLVDHTKTSSWDDFAQGFRADGVTPNMNCPGQSTADLFYFTLYNQPNYLNTYNAAHGGPPAQSLPNNSQFKCYDGMHNWTQVQPAPYDGMYKFPSVTATDANGKPTLAGTNCTICTANTAVPASDLYHGIPQLPTAGQLNKDGTVASGKYVVEVVLPPGFELVKEEDKNILIGDNYIAPVTLQFGGLGNVFILPDQASVASAYNANNPQNPTQSFGASPMNGIVPSNVPEPTWPCVGQTRIVPDFISLYPQTKQVAPFAGATRNLCDRKEVTLGDQMGAIAKFFIYTSTHVASQFTGGITDDFTSEFDPFSPQFGEKFAPPDLPVSFKDWTGTEISRVYADHWGAYNGVTYSTWEVNPPNPTGYAPTMMIVCMNDPGPIKDTRAMVVNSATGLLGPNPTLGQMITDPLFNPSYSQFCYELPFMPGTTTHMDTPVVPTSAFAGAGYNNVDCAYPTLTPAIKEVDGNQVGPYVSAAGQALRITALGDQYVNNYAYSGPSATAAPYNQKTVLRHYGFGSTAGTVALVGSDGVPHPLGNVTWSDSTITGNVPSGVPNCAVQQQAQYMPAGTTPAKCGELVITTANTAAAGQPSNAKQSIDTVTVTIGGKQPKHILASDSIQSAIDAASPGDLLMVDPTCAVPTAATTPVACSTAGATTHTDSSHNEILLMWKPVRLQGVGAASSILDGNAHPAGKLDPWRRQVNCLFGLSISGYPLVRPTGTTVYDPSGTYFCDPTMQFSVDRLPLEAVIGWDASQNGNLAEQLQEPSLMGALEGAAITVLSKGVIFPPNSDAFGVGAATPGAFPTGTTLLQNVTGVSTDHCNITPNPYPSNFMCNPSSIDGLGITDSSQGGGAIFVHGWGHNIQIANNRIYNNAGTLSGGINIGQGEFPPSYSIGGLNAAPGSCLTSADAGTYSGEQLPYCHELNVNVHHNNVSANLSTGDELFSVTPAGSGGASICTGSDYYKFNYNWICGNLSTGDGGGVGHIGYSWNGDIEHNTIIFNQSTNPTIPTNGGGILVMGAPDIDPTCGITTDADCLPAIPNAPSDGGGPGLVINANLIMGNAAESGSGGGLRFQGVNGTDVITFPSRPDRWYSVKVTNNIIANNVAGWDGAGISLVDALAVNIVNNTIVSNDTTASSGVLFNTLGAPLASSQGPCPYGTSVPTVCVSGSSAQPAGLVAVGNTPQLTTGINGLPNLAGGGKVICPTGHPNCAQVSYPVLDNDVFYQNRTFHIGVGALSTQYQQNIVTLYTGLGNTNTAVATQSTTGACSAVSYWDIGVRGDSGPGNHNGGPALAPTYSVLTNASENGAGTNNLNSSPSLVSQYCNGSRTIPELKSAGWQVPPGISDATVPNPIFNLTPTATVDEGNNWINIQWGPLTLSNPTAGGPLVNSPPLGNYALAAGSPAIDYIPNTSSTYALAPSTDFFGNRRPDPANPNHIDVGAVEFQGGATTVAIASVTGGPLAFGNVAVLTTSAARTLTLHNTGGAALTGIATTFSSARYARPAGAAGGTCGNALPPNSTCTINVVFSPTALGAVTPAGTVTIAASVAVTGSPVALTGTGVAAAPAATLAPASHAFGNAARGVILGPVQIFTLTNTGSVPLTGITQAALGGTNATEFTIVRLLSTCGPAGGGQLLGQTTLAPGAACVFTVMFKPLTTQPIGAQTATVSVTDLAGTQTSTPLTGTAQ